MKSFYFFFNRVARYTQSKESKNLSKKIAIKRAKSNAKALAIPSVSNFDEVNMRKSPAKQFLEIAYHNCMVAEFLSFEPWALSYEL